MRKSRPASSEQSEISRRESIRRSAAAAVGVAALSAGPAAAEELTVNGLPATVFGNTGLKVTKI